MDFLCLDILNSNRGDWNHKKDLKDMLGQEAWMRQLLKKWGLDAPMPMDVASLGALSVLRDNMYDVICQLPKPEFACIDQLNQINQVLASYNVRKRIDLQDGKFMLTYQEQEVGWLMVTRCVADSFAELICHHDMARIKICDNDDCGWVFYDQSKNMSRRWCDDKACGNVMKARRYRSRQKESRKGDAHEKQDSANRQTEPDG